MHTVTELARSSACCSIKSLQRGSKRVFKHIWLAVEVFAALGIIIDTIHIENLEAVHGSGGGFLLYNIAARNMLTCFEGCRTLVWVPLDLACLILAIRGYHMNQSLHWKTTYPRLIMQVRANNALWTEFVEM
jgi:hypothetical protein